MGRIHLKGPSQVLPRGLLKICTPQTTRVGLFVNRGTL